MIDTIMRGKLPELEENIRVVFSRQNSKEFTNVMVIVWIIRVTWCDLKMY